MVQGIVPSEKIEKYVQQEKNDKPDKPESLPKLTVTIPTRKVSQTSPFPRRPSYNSPDVKSMPLKKMSSNAIFNIQDVIISSELSGRINTKKWINQANIVTPEFKKSTFMTIGGSGTPRRSFDALSSEEMLHCKKNLNFDIESFGEPAECGLAQIDEDPEDRMWNRL